MDKKCQFCGQTHGPMCPQVKAIEYFANGKVKRVEFKCAADFALPPLPWNPVTWPPATTPTYPPVTWGISNTQAKIYYRDFVGPKDPANMTHCVPSYWPPH